LFGVAEELTVEQVEHPVATNLVGPIYSVRAALPHLRAQGGGRVIQIFSYSDRAEIESKGRFGSPRLTLQISPS